jgi:hypothetical protein
MKTNELRIGNWVEHNQPKRGYYTTVQESTFSVNVEKLFKPIPITEEWLLKFGFEKKYDTFEFNGLNVDGCVVHFSFDKWASEYEIENCDYTEVPSDIQHVHQLQNLYFALTGEELTIKKR